VTSGGEPGLSGGQRLGRLLRDPRMITALAFAGFGLLYMVVNAASMIDQRRALGRPIAAWQAWVLEGTSLAAWLALLPVILAIAVRLSPRPPWQVIIGHGAGLVAFSLAHGALMTALRIAAFRAAGSDYAPDTPLPARLLFEARKDIITYASILAVFLLARRLVSTAPPSTPPKTGAPRLIALRDGSRQLMLRPDEIDRVSAAGN
jgi:hypothetical protein